MKEERIPIRTLKPVAKSTEKHTNPSCDKLAVSKKRAKKTSQNVCKENNKVNIECWDERLSMVVHTGEESEDSGDEFARQIDASFDQVSDDEMRDAASVRPRTEQEEIDKAWAAFDAAVAEDPTLLPKPTPNIPDTISIRGPQYRKRKRDITDKIADLQTGVPKFHINLNVSFDVSSASRHRQDHNMHYDIDWRDAASIRKLFNSLWLEFHEYLIHEGYGIERLRLVKRLEIKLLVKEGPEVQYARCWTIRGDWKDREQREAWKDFMDTAKKQGSSEAEAHLQMVEREERQLRKVSFKDDTGYLYNPAGVRIEMKKWPVHATVEAEIVFHFD